MDEIISHSTLLWQSFLSWKLIASSLQFTIIAGVALHYFAFSHLLSLTHANTHALSNGQLFFSFSVMIVGNLTQLIKDWKDSVLKSFPGTLNCLSISQVSDSPHQLRLLEQALYHIQDHCMGRRKLRRLEKAVILSSYLGTNDAEEALQYWKYNIIRLSRTRNKIKVVPAF